MNKKYFLLLVLTGALTVSSLTASTAFAQGRGGMMGRGNQPIVKGNGQPIVAGKVTVVSGNTISITNNSNVSYTIDATNAKIEKQGNGTSSISNIAVGDEIIAQGTINGNSVVATSVIDRGGTQTPKAEKPTGFMNGMMNKMMGGIRGFFDMFGF